MCGSSLRLARPPILLLAFTALQGCVRETLPDPKSTAEAYAAAAVRGDADAIYWMLDERSRREMTPEQVRKLVADQRAELADQARMIRSGQTQATTQAGVRFDDGEQSSLIWEHERFLITSADALPAGATSPAHALEQLRRVLARRSYAGLVRVLSTPTRTAMESDVRALVKGLDNPEQLDIDQSGETAIVRLPTGHVVRLRQEDGVWRIDDIE